MPDTEPSQIRDAIEQAIEQNRVILFMKGTPDAPACGFSARTVAALQSLEIQFAAVDVLPDPPGRLGGIFGTSGRPLAQT